MEHLRKLSRPHLMHRNRIVSILSNREQKLQQPKRSEAPTLSQEDRTRTFSNDFGIEAPDWIRQNEFYMILTKILWAIVIVLFAAMTVKMCTEIFLKFLIAPTTSRLDVMYNETFQLPRSTLCLPNYAFEFDHLRARNATLTETQYRDAVDKYFKGVGLTKAKLLNNPESWPNELMSVIENYVFIMILAESLDSFDNGKVFPIPDTFEFKQDYYDYTYITEYFGDSWQAALLLEQYMAALNVSIVELRRALGLTLRDKFKLSIDLYKASGGSLIKHPIEDIETAYIDWWWTCYVVDFPRLGVNLSSAREYVDITMNATKQAPKETVYWDPVMVVDFKNQFDINLQWEGDDTTDNVIRGLLYTATIYTIRATAVYHSLPEKNGKTQCAVNSTQELCRWQCRRELIEKLCNCNAATLPAPENGSASEFPDCTMAKFTECELKYGFSDDGACVQTCLRSCDRWNYEIERYGTFETEIDWNDNIEAHKFGSIRLKVTAFDYTDFKEEYVYSVEDFVGAFGGALGLWLGLDFVILIQLIIFLISSVYKFFKVAANWKAKAQQAISDGRNRNGSKKTVVIAIEQ